MNYNVNETAAFFQATLPKAVVNILKMDSLSIEQGTFIDESIQEYHDLLFERKLYWQREKAKLAITTLSAFRA